MAEAGSVKKNWEVIGHVLHRAPYTYEDFTKIYIYDTSKVKKEDLKWSDFTEALRGYYMNSVAGKSSDKPNQALLTQSQFNALMANYNGGGKRGRGGRGRGSNSGRFGGRYSNTRGGNNQQSAGTRNRTHIQCHRCGGRGHYQDKCTSEEGNSIKCHGCGGVGHIKKNCPNPILGGGGHGNPHGNPHFQQRFPQSFQQPNYRSHFTQGQGHFDQEHFEQQHFGHRQAFYGSDVSSYASPAPYVSFWVS